MSRLAKRKKNENSKADSSKALKAPRWEKTLHHSYTTILDGFHADMTVAAMLEYLGLPDTLAPKEIRHIQLGNFTPNMFEEWGGFWNIEMGKGFIPPILQNALRDSDIALVQHVLEDEEHAYNPALKNKPYRYNARHPTLRTLAEVAHAQKIGYLHRMSEKTNEAIFHRFKKTIQDNRFYQALRLRTLPENLQRHLPAQATKFTVLKPEECVKGVISALGRAYFRAGKPESREAFLADPAKYGLSAVRDLNRVMLRPDNPEEIMDLRNILLALSLTGDLGIEVMKIDDKLFYPSAQTAKEQNPVVEFKGKLYHAAPNGTYMTLPVEIQVTPSPKAVIDNTQGNYQAQRSLPNDWATNTAMTEGFEEGRIAEANKALPSCARNTRKHWEQHGDYAPDDMFARVIYRPGWHNAASANAIRIRARQVARDEIPHHDRGNKGIIAEFDPFAAQRSPLCLRTIRELLEPTKKEPTSASHLALMQTNGNSIVPLSMEGKSSHTIRKMSQNRRSYTFKDILYS